MVRGVCARHEYVMPRRSAGQAQTGAGQGRKGPAGGDQVAEGESDAEKG